MIRYIKHNDIDFEKWDACIDRSLNAMFYAWSWYLDMVSSSWDALVEDDYIAVMPLPFRKKWGVSYLYQPFFAQQLGVFSTYSLAREHVMRFLSAIPAKYRYIDICLNTFNQISNSSRFELRRMVTYELDLIEEYGSLKNAYSSNASRNIRKAARSGVFIARHGRPEEIIDAFRNHRGRNLKSYSGHDYMVLKHLIYAGMHRGLVSIYSAYTRQNNFCAGAVFFRGHDKTVFLFSGTTGEARENGAMFLLADRFISDHAGQKLTLDFEGSSDPDLARFYSGFGAKECVFLQMKSNRLPPVLKSLAMLYLRYRRGVPETEKKGGAK